MKPFGVEVIEIVTGFVQSNILHHGLHAPETSPYLPIKSTVEDIKYHGNTNGMSAEAYAKSVVAKLIRPRVSPEIWEGALARSLRLLIMLLPLQLLVSHSVTVALIRTNKGKCTELDFLPKVQTRPCRSSISRRTRG